MKKITAIRGAVCCENTAQDITEWVCKMVNKIVEENNLKEKDLISMHFTITNEITTLNPCTALRKGNTIIDTSHVALFCSQEAQIDGGMKNVIRLLLHTYMKKSQKKQNVYLNGAEKLRPDYSSNN